MSNITQFDVLVVYSSKIASSAAAADSVTPFSKDSTRWEYTYPYEYFLKECVRQKLTAAFTTSQDISGPGLCESYWTHQNMKWIKHEELCTAPIIFDKFSPVNEKQRLKRDLFFSSSQVQPFNDEYLFSLFFDKHKMYQKLAQFSVPTVAIRDASMHSVEVAIKKLKNLVAFHPHSTDFAAGVVIKDRFGAGGIHIYKVDENFATTIMAIMHQNPHVHFIAQPFAKFDQGFTYQNLVGSTDIRLIYQGKKIVQTYIRMAKVGDFRCNEHQGGTLTYIPLRAIPTKAIQIANRIANLLTHTYSLFALDFIISNLGNVYLLEGNTGPGLDWNLKLKKNEQMAKKLIRIIVKNLHNRSGISEILPLRPIVEEPVEYIQI